MISVDEAEALSPAEIAELYSDYINPQQVKLFKRLSPPRDLVRSAEGAWLELESGRMILDLTGGIGVLGHGHNHAEILRVRRSFASQKKMEVYKSFLSPYSAALAHNVAEVLPGDLRFSYFPNSGAEAVEGAVKMAYKFHRGSRNDVLVADIGFHGKLLGAGSFTLSKENSFRFPEISGVRSAVYGDIDDWEQVFKRSVDQNGASTVFAVLIEPLSSSSMTEADADFLVALRKLCDHYGAILIFDEVYTGWGRTGHLFNFMRVPGLIPDLLVYAKTFGGGKASIAGYTAREHVFKRAYDTGTSDSTLHSTTYFGFGEETVTALEAVRLVVEEDFPRRAREIESSFTALLGQSGAIDGWFSEVRSFGALSGLMPEEGMLDFAARSLGKVFDNAVPAPRGLFASRLVSAAGTEYLYRHHGVLTYVGFNAGSPLKISFPLISEAGELETGASAVADLLSQPRSRLALEIGRMLGQTWSR